MGILDLNKVNTKIMLYYGVKDTKLSNQVKKWKKSRI